MKKQGIIFTLALLIMGSLQAQKVSVGLFGGVSSYSGEMTNEYSIFLEETRPAVGGIVRYEAHPFFTLRFGITSAYISGADENFSEPEKQLRNLSFRSNILEVSAIAEINIIGYDVQYEKFSPYIFGGIAGFYHNPEALYEAEWVDLQPLGTEGQGTTVFPDREPYSLYQFAIPFGIGTKFSLGSGLTLAAEVGVRKTFTDYLDDVSQTYVNADELILENGQMAYNLSNRTGELPGRDQPIDFGNDDLRGDPTNDDWYVMAGITFTYTIGVPMGGGGAKEGCPVNW